MTPRLTLASFEAFFTEVHGQPPYPWQKALVARVLETGTWPDVIDVPTGLGKTALIDIAVFVAAARPDAGRRRVFFVVDRRLVVDEAFQHAVRLRDALRAGRGACAEVSRLLRQDGDQADGFVLDVTRMRGGTTWSWRWLERPDRHAIVTGTIDQVGSRLLFRGYGVGEYLRPLDAALTGTDSLIIIDEAHLAEPFARTVADAVAAEPPGAARRPVVITMSATTATLPGQSVHRITDADEQDPRARRLLDAARDLYLVSPGKAPGAVERSFADWARQLAGEPDSGRVVALVCNTVSRARAVFTMLASGDDADAVLLTGRTRDIDRAYLIRAGWYERSRAGRARGPGRPLVLVSTQAIEVGANIDADALVTESASLAALIQRLGRLNRRGELPGAPAIVVHDPATRPHDPVYGGARLATWNWLSTLTQPLKLPRPAASAPLSLPVGRRVSPLALRAPISCLDPAAAEAMRGPCPYIPVLTRPILDAWTRTSPVPHPDTPVAPFLHGIGHGEPDVSIVWRSGSSCGRQAWQAMAAAVPPSAEEAIQVPLHAARQWLLGEAIDASDVCDFDGTESQPVTDPGTRSPADNAAGQLLRYRDRDDIQFIQPRQVRPGDTLIVPAEKGGCDEYGWNPASARPVTDVADLAFRRGRPMMRLSSVLKAAAAAYHPELADPIAGLIALAAQDPGEDGPDSRDCRQAIAQVLQGIALPRESAEEPPLVRNLRILAGSCRALPHAPGSGNGEASGILLVARGGGLEGDSGSAGSSALGQPDPASLTAHQQAVARRARQFADNLMLDEGTATAVALAAGMHDEGKRDPRFQAMLRGRTPATLTPQLPLLAKSAMDPADRAAFARAQRKAGYPPGMRHEALSAQIGLMAADACPLDIDTGLLIHLIAAHHGRSRPLLPPVHDPDPQLVRIDLADGLHEVSTAATVDWSAPSRFAYLNSRYGRWGLALLETIVRLADIWCSEHDERAPEETHDD